MVPFENLIMNLTCDWFYFIVYFLFSSPVQIIPSVIPFETKHIIEDLTQSRIRAYSISKISIHILECCKLSFISNTAADDIQSIFAPNSCQIMVWSIAMFDGEEKKYILFPSWKFSNLEISLHRKIRNVSNQ